MLNSEVERFEALFLELRAEIRALKIQQDQPLLLTPKKAAAKLSVSLATMKRLIAQGEILTTRLGKRAMVPMSEIDRVSTPGVQPTTIKRFTPVKLGRPKAINR